MNHILFRSLLICSTVCREMMFPVGFLFLFDLPHDGFEKLIISESIIKCNAPKHWAKNNIYIALVLILRRAGQNKWGQNCCILKNTRIWRKFESGESSFFFIWCEIKTKIAQDYSTALKDLLDMINSYWLQKLVELWPSKKVGSNELWDLGNLWQPVSYSTLKNGTRKTSEMMFFCI